MVETGRPGSMGFQKLRLRRERSPASPPSPLLARACDRDDAMLDTLARAPSPTTVSRWTTWMHDGGQKGAPAMTVTLNHTIVHATDKHASAAFLADLLDLEPPTTYGPFAVVQVGDTSLDFADDHAPDGFQRQHYAFLVSEDDFDAIWKRIRLRGLDYWADPFHRTANRINRNDGGRGLYWEDPDGHNLEILTVPYGGWQPQR